MKCARCHKEFVCQSPASQILPIMIVDQYKGDLCLNCLTMISENLRTEDDYCSLCRSYYCDGYCDCPD